MNLLPPSRNPVLIGHDNALRQIEAAYISGRMPHAWLITGIEGTGKTTLAWHAAHYVLSGGKNPLGNLDMDNPVSRLVAGEAHPDLFVLKRPVDEKTGNQKDTIPVEDARKIAPFLQMTSTYGGWRIAIIDEAHALNRYGQNAILKVIEEPPSNSLILLTASAPGMLVPTIRSRCRVLPLRPLNDTEMRVVLNRAGLNLPSSDLNRLIQLSGGSPGFALRIAESDILPLFHGLEEILLTMPKLDIAKLHSLADQVGQKTQADSFAVITRLLTEKLRQKAKNDALCERKGQLYHSLQIWDKVREIFTMTIESKLDKKLAFINALLQIRNSGLKFAE